MVDEAWEVYKRMATLEYGALLVGVESWSGDELGRQVSSCGSLVAHTEERRGSSGDESESLVCYSR